MSALMLMLLAAPCPQRVALEGPADLVAEVDRALVARGLERWNPRARCAPLKVRLRRRSGAVLVSKGAAPSTAVERRVSSPKLAALIIETWSRPDLVNALLSAPPLPPGARARATVGEDASEKARPEPRRDAPGRARRSTRAQKRKTRAASARTNRLRSNERPDEGLDAPDRTLRTPTRNVAGGSNAGEDEDAVEPVARTVRIPGEDARPDARGPPRTERPGDDARAEATERPDGERAVGRPPLISAPGVKERLTSSAPPPPRREASEPERPERGGPALFARRLDAGRLAPPTGPNAPIEARNESEAGTERASGAASQGEIVGLVYEAAQGDDPTAFDIGVHGRSCRAGPPGSPRSPWPRPRPGSHASWAPRPGRPIAPTRPPRCTA